MREPGPRVAAWFTLVTDLLAEPLTALPHAQIFGALHTTFDLTAVGWHWAEPDGRFGVTMSPGDALDPIPADVWTAWRSAQLHDCHALLTWYARTGDTRPWTVGRVPTTMVPRQRRILVERPLRAVGLDQQLAINYRTDPGRSREFVLGRSGRDFSDEDVLVAGYVQRGLGTLARQVDLLARASGTGPSGPDPGFGLSGRERAVLQLLAEGHSTRAIGHTLGCSPRTVEKHLERTYRKLEVRDRLNAVRIARAYGLVGLESR